MEKFKEQHFGICLMTIILSLSFIGNVNAQQLSLAEKSVSSLGTENAALKLLEGTFDVKETIWSSPTASPVYHTRLVARRGALEIHINGYQGSRGADACRKFRPRRRK